MATLGIRKNAWQGLSARDKELVKAIGGILDLGEPAEWKQPPNTRWFLFCDTRFTMRDIAYFGALAAHLGDVPAGYSLPMIDILDEEGVKVGERLDRKLLRSQAKTFLDPFVVWPVQISEGDSNPWQSVLDAQGTPAQMQMADHPPATWEPVEVT